MKKKEKINANKINIAIIRSSSPEYFEKCLKSLKSTINLNEFNIEIFKETKKDIRGNTLNKIIKKFGTKSDILISADDIEYTKGWFEKLKKNKKRAHIWGASMLYPGSKIIQDNGYDLVKFENQSFLRPILRGAQIKRSSLKKNWKYTDCVCGCFLYLNKEVFNYQKKFYPRFGMNRWDEYTFILKAMSKGCRLAVLNHFFYHHAISTKNKNKKIYGSISYQIEKELWKKLENEFIKKKKIKKIIKLNICKQVINLFKKNKGKILFYGAGTVSENLLKYRKHNFIDVTSSMTEEIGKKLNKNYDIKDFKKINIINYSKIIITASDYAEQIYRDKILPLLKKKGIEIKTFKIAQTTSTTNLTYNLLRIY